MERRKWRAEVMEGKVKRDESVTEWCAAAENQYRVKMLMLMLLLMMMTTATIQFSRKKIQMALSRCLNCCFTEESNLVLFGSSCNEVTGSPDSCAQYKKGLVASENTFDR